jgi:hypothetical protein
MLRVYKLSIYEMHLKISKEKSNFDGSSQGARLGVFVGIDIQNYV